MAEGGLTPPPSPLGDQPDESLFPENLTVLIWNIAFNEEPELQPETQGKEPAASPGDVTKPAQATGKRIGNPLQATKEIVAATLVREKPALVLLQEVKWAKTWVQTHLIAKGLMEKTDHLEVSEEGKEDWKRVLEIYGLCLPPAKFEYVGTTDDGQEEKLEVGRTYDVYIMYRTDQLQTKGEKKTKEVHVSDKSLMKFFADQLLENFKDILERFPQDYKMTERRHIGGLASALQDMFIKILGQTVCITLESKSPRPGKQPERFLAMSVHMPYKAKNIAELGRATLEAAIDLAKAQCLPLIIGGDWNVAVSKVLGNLLEVYPKKLHSTVPHDPKSIDGVFMYSENETAVLEFSNVPVWEQPSDDAEALVKFYDFAKACYMYKSNHMPILVKKPE